MRLILLKYRSVIGFLLKETQLFAHTHCVLFSSQKPNRTKDPTKMDTIPDANDSQKNLSNVSYADALQRGKTTASEDSSNNNPVENDLSNGNGPSLQAPVDASAANDGPHTSVSVDNSFEDDTLNSQASLNDLNSTRNDESFVSTATDPSSPKSSENLGIHEPEDSGDESDVEGEVSNLDSLYPSAVKWRFRRPGNPAMELPKTCTVLETNFGSRVYLVGTAHFSVESQEDVSRTIKAVQPDVVMLELCKDRINTLSLDEATILKEAEDLNLRKMKTTLEQNGVLQGILYLLLLSMSVHFTKELGMAPGGEFRRAYQEAQQIPGCTVHLGDRPIHVSLRRALATLSFWQKIRVAWQILRLNGPITKEEVERCKDKDLLEKMLEEMTGEFPELSQVFVRERDIYLAYSLQMAALPFPSPRNPAELVPSTVVGVVGIGHVAGIKEHWGKVTDEDVKPLMHVPEPSMASKIFKQTVRVSLFGLAAYALYKMVPRSIISSIKPKSLFSNSSKV